MNFLCSQYLDKVRFTCKRQGLRANLEKARFEHWGNKTKKKVFFSFFSDEQTMTPLRQKKPFQIYLQKMLVKFVSELRILKIG